MSETNDGNVELMKKRMIESHMFINKIKTYEEGENFLFFKGLKGTHGKIFFHTQDSPSLAQEIRDANNTRQFYFKNDLVKAHTAHVFFRDEINFFKSAAKELEKMQQNMAATDALDLSLYTSKQLEHFKHLTPAEIEGIFVDKNQKSWITYFEKKNLDKENEQRFDGFQTFNPNFLKTKYKDHNLLSEEYNKYSIKKIQKYATMNLYMNNDKPTVVVYGNRMKVI